MSIKTIKQKQILETVQGFNGVFVTRRKFVEQKLAEGWKVETVKLRKVVTKGLQTTVVEAGAERRFMAPDGRFMTERDITKTAMDLAEGKIS